MRRMMFLALFLVIFSFGLVFSYPVGLTPTSTDTFSRYVDSDSGQLIERWAAGDRASSLVRDLYSLYPSSFNAAPSRSDFFRGIEPTDRTALNVCRLYGYDTLISYSHLSAAGNNCYSNEKFSAYLWSESSSQFIKGPRARRHRQCQSQYAWLTFLTCERNIYECNDGEDNDFDGLIDLADSDCESATDNEERPRLCSFELDADNNGVNESVVSGTLEGDPAVCVAESITCSPPFAHCDSSFVNGCEVNTDTDVTNCGGCIGSGGVACSAGQECSLGSCVDLISGDNTWTDMNGDFITTASIGSYVKMWSPWAGRGNYTVYDDGTLVRDIIQGYLEIENTWSSLRFNVSNELENELSPGGLGVTPSTDNVPMRITVVNPHCGTHYMEGDSVRMHVRLEDPDDIISGNISVSGVKITDFTNLNDFNDSLPGVDFYFDYVFTDADNVQILFQATNTNYERYREVVNVIVIDPLVDDVYVASCIDEPKNFDRFTSSSVRFRANSTKALNYTVADGIELIPIDDLEFTWTFFHRGSQTFTCTNLGRESCFAAGTTTMYDFFKEFSTVEENTAVLSVGIL